MVLFRNNKTGEFKADAPWLKNVLIEKENTTSIVVTEVPISEVKNENPCP